MRSSRSNLTKIVRNVRANWSRLRGNSVAPSSFIGRIQKAKLMGEGDGSQHLDEEYAHTIRGEVLCTFVTCRCCKNSMLWWKRSFRFFQQALPDSEKNIPHPPFAKEGMRKCPDLTQHDCAKNPYTSRTL